MRNIYTFLLYLLTPFVVMRLYWKSRRLPAYRQRIAERFSFGRPNNTPVDVWVHAVSLGEVVAVTPLIELMLAKSWRVVVTTMTPTGSEQVIRRFGQRVIHQYIPYDLPWALRRFFKKTKPRIGLIMETELWPNLIDQAKRHAIPLLLANARLSDRSFKQYKKVAYLFKPILNQFTQILAQSEEDAQRFIALGAANDLVHVIGNMKFDVPLQVEKNSQALVLKAAWGSERTVMIAASTHDDEEHQILSRLRALQLALPGVLLLLVPRHPERFQEIYKLSKGLGFNTGLQSQSNVIDTSTDVIVIDSLGALLGFYQVSDYAFVGGSLVPVGGHNVLEPIALRVPVFCGPHMTNSKEICRDLQTASAITMVEHADALMSALIKMHHEPLHRQQQIENASMVLAANRGAVERCMARLEAFYTVSPRT